MAHVFKSSTQEAGAGRSQVASTTLQKLSASTTLQNHALKIKESDSGSDVCL